MTCGKVDAPRLRGIGPGWLAIALWVASALCWGLIYVLDEAWLVWIAVTVFLGTLVYTLWYFWRREKACRHCGATDLEPAGTGPV